jgi:hypothetical protein
MVPVLWNREDGAEEVTATADFSPKPGGRLKKID